MENNYRGIIEKYKYRLFRLQHVVGVGYGLREKDGQRTGQKSIIVLVDKKVDRDQLSSYDVIPQKVEKYQTDVIEVGDLHFLNLRTERMRPVRPGISIGHYKISAGTLGAVVKDKRSGKPLLLSNNHVLANITNGKDGRAQKGDPILQPGVYDNGSEPDDVIGHLERFVPINGSGETECPIARGMENMINIFLRALRPEYNMKFFKMGIENVVDCAVAKPVNREIVDSRIMDIGEVKGTSSAEVDMMVKKSGRTTGLTRGRVRVVDATVEVKMSENDTAVFTNQFITDPFSKAGDSGSLILNEDNKAVGLLFAGSNKATVCNHISNVLSKLNVEI